MIYIPSFKQFPNISHHENLGDLPTDSGWLFRLAKIRPRTKGLVYVPHRNQPNVGEYTIHGGVWG